MFGLWEIKVGLTLYCQIADLMCKDFPGMFI